MTTIVALGDKLGDMQQALLDRMEAIQALKEEAQHQHEATSKAVFDAHTQVLRAFDHQIAQLKALIGD